MIGSITGKVKSVEDTSIIVDTQSGLGYIVYIPPSLHIKIKQGDEVSVLIYHHIREDVQTLFGFETPNEKKLFHLLLDVPGVGPKTAFTIVSHISLEEAISATQKNDYVPFSSISGIGKKTALKIVLELSQKIKSEFMFEKEMSETDTTAIDALISLGYQQREAKEAVKKLPETMTVEQKVQEVLRRQVSKN